MTVLECYQFVQNRLNRLSTNSGDNIPKFQFVEAFNTCQLQWCDDRIKLSETNIVRKDEVQHLLKQVSLSPVKDSSGMFYEVSIPDDYFRYKRSYSHAPCMIENRLVKEGDINVLLKDMFWKPSIEWEEALCTIINNKIRVYVDDFKITKVDLIYYREPQKINMADGYSDINGNATSNVDPELSGSSLIEVLMLTCNLLSADSTDQWNYQTTLNNTQRHT